MGVPIQNWISPQLRESSSGVFQVHLHSHLWVGRGVPPGGSQCEDESAENDSLQRVFSRGVRGRGAKSHPCGPWRHLWQLPEMWRPRYLQRPIFERGYRRKWRVVELRSLWTRFEQVHNREKTPGSCKPQTDLLPAAGSKVQAVQDGEELLCGQILRVHRCLCADYRKRRTREVEKSESA